MGSLIAENAESQSTTLERNNANQSGSYFPFQISYLNVPIQNSKKNFFWKS